MEHKVDKHDLPSELIHIVPLKRYDEYTDKNGVYDPRNRKEFGSGSPFIHTTPTVDQMVKYLSYYKTLKDTEFYLLKINTETFCGNETVTSQIVNNREYHHLWFALKKENYRLYLVKKEESGQLIVIKELVN